MPLLQDDVILNKILSAATYADFKKFLLASNCPRCELCKSRTQIVPDRGNPGAKIMLVGEAPGRNEDEQGKAFVGRAGRLLDGLFLDLGFDTNKDSLIANVAKCRPPDNRAPKPIEAETCIPYLKKQIELVGPKVIVLLGATALKYIQPGNKFKMSEQVGKFFEHKDYPGIRFITIFHPAYILRDPRKKPLMIEHLKTITDYWRKNVH